MFGVWCCKIMLVSCRVEEERDLRSCLDLLIVGQAMRSVPPSLM
jgi:hypothetical protein